MKKDIDFSKKLSPIPKEDESLVGNVSFNVLFHVRSEGKNNKAWAQWMNLIKRTEQKIKRWTVGASSAMGTFVLFFFLF